MLLPDGRMFVINDGILQETATEGRVILWVPSSRADGYQYWDRIGTVARAPVICLEGVCSIAATSVSVRQSLKTSIGRFFHGLRRATSDRVVTMPDGTSAEQHGSRQVNLIITWSADEVVLLDEAKIKSLWPQSQKSQSVGRNLFIVWGINPDRPQANPLAEPEMNEGEPTRVIAERAVAIARRNGDPHRVVTALADLGFAYISEGDALRADEILREALTEARRLGDSAQAADILSTLALAANTLKQPEQAKEFLGLVLAHARVSGDRYVEKLALDRLAVAVLNLGDRVGALTHLKQAREIASLLHDNKHEADLLWSAAILYADLGQPLRTIQCAQTAVDLLRRLGNPTADWYADHLSKYKSGESGIALASPSKASPYLSGTRDTVALPALPLGPTGQTPTGPSLLRMAVTAAKAMATFVGSGFKAASQEAYQERLAVCSKCEHHTGLRCRVCGCITRTKARMLHERCPTGKWPA